MINGSTFWGSRLFPWQKKDLLRAYRAKHVWVAAVVTAQFLCVYQQDGGVFFDAYTDSRTDNQDLGRSGGRADNTGFLLHLHRASGKRRGQMGSVELVHLVFLSLMYHGATRLSHNQPACFCRDFSALATAVYRVSVFLEMGSAYPNGARVEILVLLLSQERASDAFGLAGASAVFYGVLYPVWAKRALRYSKSSKRIDNNSGSMPVLNLNVFRYYVYVCMCIKRFVLRCAPGTSHLRLKL